MHLILSAVGVDSSVPLFTVEVDGQGDWRYESRAVEEARGELSEADQAQLKNLHDKVNWSLETLNAPVSSDDRTLFKLDVDHGDGNRALYQTSESMTHRSWEFRDLVHFLRHNVALAGDPVGRIPDEVRDQPPAVQ